RPALCPEQRQNLQGLTPEQRAALLEALRSQQPTTTTQLPTTIQPAPTLDETLDAMRRLGQEQLPPGGVATEIPRLEPDSTVVVEFTLRYDLGERVATDPKTN